LAESSNWPLIQRDGLLSATRLLAAAGLAPADRERLQRAQRLQHTELPNQVHIRDQGPMPPAALERCLCGMTPSDWYSAVNARVFFWLDPARLNRQRAACGARPQVVMMIDAQALVAAHAAARCRHEGSHTHVHSEATFHDTGHHAHDGRLFRKRPF